METKEIDELIAVATDIGFAIGALRGCKCGHLNERQLEAIDRAVRGLERVLERMAP